MNREHHEGRVLALRDALQEGSGDVFEGEILCVGKDLLESLIVRSVAAKRNQFLEDLEVTIGVLVLMSIHGLLVDRGELVHFIV